MKNNYPIVYTLVEINDNNFNCYIPIKAYLIGSEEKFLSNGRSYTSYRLVHMYEYNKYLDTWTYNEPTGDFEESYKSKYIFNNYEAAEEEARKLNKKILNTNTTQESIDNYKICLREYKMLAKKFFYQLYELDNKDVKVLNGLIDSEGNKYKMNLYDCINFYSDMCVVYSVSKELYNELSKNKDYVMNNIDEIKENSKPLLLINNKVAKIIDDELEGLYYINYDQLVYDINKKPVKTNDIKDLNVKTFFTTETYKDVVLSYKKYENIDFKSKKLTK